MPIKKDVRCKDRNDLRHDVMVRACEKKHPFMHPSDVITMLRVGHGMTKKEVSQYLGVPVSSLHIWTKPEAKIHIYTKKEREAKRRNAIALNIRIKQGKVSSGKKWRAEFATSFFKKGKKS